MLRQPRRNWNVNQRGGQHDCDSRSPWAIARTGGGSSPRSSSCTTPDRRARGRSARLMRRPPPPPLHPMMLSLCARRSRQTLRRSRCLWRRQRAMSLAVARSHSSAATGRSLPRRRRRTRSLSPQLPLPSQPSKRQGLPATRPPCPERLRLGTGGCPPSPPGQRSPPLARSAGCCAPSAILHR